MLGSNRETKLDLRRLDWILVVACSGEFELLVKKVFYGCKSKWVLFNLCLNICVAVMLVFVYIFENN